MRDPKRIHSILTCIEKIWETCPDMRLGQLLLGAVREGDLFDLEDEALVVKLLALYGLKDSDREQRVVDGDIDGDGEGGHGLSLRRSPLRGWGSGTPVEDYGPSSTCCDTVTDTVTDPMDIDTVPSGS